MRRLLKLNSEFSKNVLTLFTGATIAQIIPLLVSPLLTRIFFPEDFGLLALFLSVSSLIAIVTTLQYESAIMLPKQEEDAASIVMLCVYITLFISMLSFIAMWLFNDSISELLGNKRIGGWLYLVPFSVLLSGLYNIFNNWSSRNKQYKRLAIRSVAQTGTTAGVKLGMGVCGATQSGLIVGTIAGQLTSTSILSWLSVREGKHLFRKVTIQNIIKNARAYKNFPKYTLWQGFLDVLNVTVTTVIISKYFGSNTLGFYAFTVGILQRPLQLIGNSISQVYYQRASELYNEGGDVWGLTKNIMKKLTLMAFAIFLPLGIIGPSLFGWFFGVNWSIAGEYARLLIPWLAIRFVCSPVSSIASVYGKQRQFFINTILLNAIFPLVMFACYLFNFKFEYGLFLGSTITGLFLSGIIVWFRKISRSVDIKCC